MKWPTPPITLHTEATTARFAQRLAKRLAPGDVILLRGEIGAGKSFFARAAIRSLLGPDTEVPSPTFTLVQAYPFMQSEIWHADLYRLSNPDEAVELGLLDAFETAVCFVEWPDQLGPYLPEDALVISLKSGLDVHTLSFSGHSRWVDLVAKVLSDDA